MASDLISRKALVKAILEERDKIFGTYCSTQLERYGQSMRGGIRRALRCVETAPAVDAIPIDTVAEMLADLFKDECCCNYNDIDEWLSELCEHSDTCPRPSGENECWKQFIKNWKEQKNDHNCGAKLIGGKQDA